MPIDARAEGPAQPRPASTIMLLRDGPTGLEVFMVVRHREIDFAGGALVFPGGRVEPGDATLGHGSLGHGSLGHGSLGHATLGDRDRALGDQAHGSPDGSFRVAAIREAFEETGILLARRGEVLLGAHDLPREADWAVLLAEHALLPATDLLRHFAHWITPDDMPKRFDTHFFLAEAPPDQIGLHDGHEAVDSIWINPAQALAEAEAGQRILIFPTRLNLWKLSRYTTVAAAMADHGPVVTVCPEPFEDARGKWMRIPEAAGYGAGEFRAVVRPMKPRGAG